MGLTPIAPTQNVDRHASMIVNGALVAFLILVVAWEIGRLVLARRRGRAAARLHIRIVALFSIVAAAPAILVAIVASVTLDRGLDNWFSTQHQGDRRHLRHDRPGLSSTSSSSRSSSDLSGVEERDRAGARPLLVDNPDRFQSFLDLDRQLATRLPGLFLVKSDGSIIASAMAARDVRVSADRRPPTHRATPRTSPTSRPDRPRDRPT